MTETKVEGTPANTEEEVRIEEVTADDKPATTENTNAEATDAGADASEEGRSSKQSKAEKKARKQMQKLGLKPITDITRATIKKSKNVHMIFIFIFIYFFTNSLTNLR